MHLCVCVCSFGCGGVGVTCPSFSARVPPSWREVEGGCGGWRLHGVGERGDVVITSMPLVAHC